MAWNFKTSSLWKRLLMAVLIIAAASAFRVAFFGGLGKTIPYLLYYPALTVAALYGGLMMGLLATVLSAGLVFFWIEKGHLSPPELLSLVVFVASGTLISFICEFMRRSQVREKLARKEAVVQKEKLQREIAERQQSEAAMIASETRYRRLFESAKDGILILDAETGMIVDVNPFLVETLGFSRDNFLGKKVWELGVFKDIVANQDNFVKLQQQEYIRYEDMPLKTSDGRQIEVEFVSNVYLVNDRKVIQCNIRDVSARKQAEIATTRLASIVASSHDAIIGKDLDGIVTFWNQGAERMFGYTAGEMLGVSIRRLIPMGHSAEEDSILERIRHGESVESFETLRLTKDERLLEVSVMVSPIKNAIGQIIGVSKTVRDITARKQAEAALMESESKYSRLLEGTPDIIYSFSNKRGGLYYSRHVEAILGYSVKYLLEHPFLWQTSIEPADLDAVHQAVQKFATGESFDIEYRIKDSSGKWHWLRDRSISRRQEGDEVFIDGIASDITERKQVEEALHAKQQLIEEIINVMPVRIFWKDKNLVFLGCNQALARDVGLADPKDVIGKDDFQLPCHEQAELFRRDDREIIESGCSKLLIEERQTTPDGKVITLLTSKIPLRDSKGEIIGVLGAYMDITERKRMEEAHARLATAVEQSADSIVITDTNGTILYVNPAFEKTTGYACAEAIGQNPRILKSGKQDAEFYRQMWGTLKRGEVWEGHFINKHKDGTLYDEEATISPVRDAAGSVINYVSVKRDVTLEMQLEAQLRQSQKMEAIGTLAGGVAHDFNNILAILQIEASLLKMTGTLSPAQAKLADEIGNAVARGAALTRQLLLFSRKGNPQPHDFELNVVITDLSKMLVRTLGEKIQVQLQLAEQPMFVHADESMMSQVILNLAVNARDAMTKGGQLVIATAGVEFDETTAAQVDSVRPGSFVCLTVSDSGCGIPPEILSKIFEPFFTTKPVGKGTGLGLATVFGIVQQHKGWITVDSKVGQGTTFKVYLPRLASLTAKKNVEKMPATVLTGTEAILLVEDEAPLRDLIRKTLAQLGYQVLEAPTGVAALEVWKEHREKIRLLLTDRVMPGGLNGTELAQRLLREKPKLKVIYMSGYSSELTDRKLALQEGVNFLAKPFQLQKLEQIIRARLDESDVA